MSDPGESLSRPTTDYVPSTGGDPIVPLTNLSAISSRMDSLQNFLTNAISRNTVVDKEQMDMVSAELTSAIHQVIVNGAALLACSSSQISNQPPQVPEGTENSSQNRKVGGSDLKVNRRAYPDTKLEVLDEDLDEDEVKEAEDDYEVVEIDAVELLAEHNHICEICGKGFKRDANLRMHMRAHGEEYKKPEALAKPALEKSTSTAYAGTYQAAAGSGTIRRRTRFSCPYAGCNRNQNHSRFRPLKSVTCVKNHFKRSHCPKTYRCNRCNKKNFSVMTDLKSHLKHCGEAKWKCSCGNTFSRKDKLFGHMALFEGHMPAVGGSSSVDVAGDKSKEATAIEEDEDDDLATGVVVAGIGSSSNSGCGYGDGFFEGMFHEGFDDFSVHDWLDPPCNSPEMNSAMDQLYRNK